MWKEWGVLVGLDESAEVHIPLEPGPCAASTVTRLERVEVRASRSARMFRGAGGGANQSATREMTRTGRETLRVWTDVPQVPSTEEHGNVFAVFA